MLAGRPGNPQKSGALSELIRKQGLGPFGVSVGVAHLDMVYSVSGS